jgi:tRNA dimethylallyltransferase
MQIANKLKGEIIAVDSRTIYTGLDIGTAKPSQEQQKYVRHWGLDLVLPSDHYSAKDFKDYALSAIQDITERNRLPIMVGGTGLYMDGVLYDFSFTEPNHKLRRELQDKSVEELQGIIYEKGFNMPTNNKNKLHLITAIERNGVVGERKPLRSGAVVVGVSPDRKVLRDTIKTRAHKMIEDGVLKEIESASAAYGWNAPGLQGGIYTCMRPYIEGRESLEEAINKYIISDMHLAKRQMTWLKRNTDIHWFSDSTTAESWILNSLRSTL